MRIPENRSKQKSSLPLIDAVSIADGAFLAAVQKVIAERRQRAPMGWRPFWKTQLRFVGWRIWALQGALLLGSLLALAGLAKGAGTELIAILPQLLFYLSLLVSGAVLPILYRSFRYKMHEIEATTYYATPRILLAKLIVVGVGDLASLAAIALLAVLKTAMPLESAVLHLLCPFLLAICSILHLANHYHIKELVPGGAAVYGLLILGYELLQDGVPAAFGRGTGLFWALICAALLTLCGFQLCRITERSGFAERQIV